MDNTLVLVFIPAVMVALLPIVPQMVEFRIRVLEWIGWTSMAELHQNAFSQIVISVRVVLVLLGLVFVVKLIAL